MSADHLALVTDLRDARFDLHISSPSVHGPSDVLTEGPRPGNSFPGQAPPNACLALFRALLRLRLGRGRKACGLAAVGGGAPDRLLVAVDDAALGQVVGTELHDDPVVGKDPDVVHPHLPADV